MRKKIKIPCKICVNDLSISSVDQLMDVSYCVQCAAASPIGVLFRLQVNLENRVEHQNRRHHDRAVTDSGHSQRTLLPSRLRYEYPPHGKWSITSAFQLLRQFFQPSLCSVRFDVLERLIVYSRSSAIGFAA